MFEQVFKLIRPTRRGIPAFSALLLALFLSIKIAAALPNDDTYIATARNLPDAYQNLVLDFRIYFTNLPSFMNLAKLKARVDEYTGIAAGLNVTGADGAVHNISTWAESGHVIEFTFATSDGGFISFSPFSNDWGLHLRDIDLLAAEGQTPEVIGAYIDFQNSNQELLYQLNPILLSASPVGVGRHPFENHDVLYFTKTGTEFANFSIASITNSKLAVDLDSQNQLESFSMQSIVAALGITNDISANPKVNTLKIGILLKGIQVPAQQILLPGDFNCDATVDAADLAVWKNNFGMQNVRQCSGDANNDRNVDGGDFMVWQRQLGKVYQAPAPPPASVSVSVPAPESSVNDASDESTPPAPNDAGATTTFIENELLNPAITSGKNDGVVLEKGPKDKKKPAGKPKKKIKNKNKNKAKKNSQKKNSTKLSKSLAL